MQAFGAAGELEEFEARCADAVREKVSIGVRWKLLDGLYARNAMLPRLAFEALAVGAMLWLRMGADWVLPWTATVLLSIVWRGVLFRSYRAGSDRFGSEAWARRFIASAWTASALWGGLGALIVLVPDPVVHLIVVGALSRNVGAVVVCDSNEPRAAIGQVLLMKTPLAAACFATQDIVYGGFGLLTAVELVFWCARVRHLHGQSVQMLKTSDVIALTNSDLARANEKLSGLTTTDPLTKLGNRRGFNAACRREWGRALREHRPISLMLIDLDHFDKLNEILGRDAGDLSLQRVADAIQTTLRRPTDVAARYGGKRFAVVLPDTDAVALYHLAERIRIAIMLLAIAHPRTPSGVVTGSIGCATATPHDDRTPALLIEQAELALERARSSGRNGICAWDAALDGRAADERPVMAPAGQMPGPSGLAEAAISVREFFNPGLDAGRAAPLAARS